MIRLTRQTDYGIVLMTHFATAAAGEPRNARELAAAVRLTLPMVSKILKKLVRAGLLVSVRGVKGGYHLARPPAQVTVAEIIQALEGPVAMTSCGPGPGLCEHETTCAVSSNWQIIHRAVGLALDSLTLTDMAHPIYPERLLTLRRYAPRSAAPPAASQETTS